MAGLPAAAFLKLLNSGARSDYRITCNGTEFKVHKMILASASDYFRVICAEDGSYEENTNGVVDLSDHEPEIIARVIYFLYTGTYSPTLTDDVSDLLTRGKTNSEVESSVVMVASPPKPSDDDVRHPQFNSTDTLRVEQLRISALTYQCADRLDIGNLRQTAFDSFRNTMETCKNDEDLVTGLSDVVSLVYEVTAPNDRDLRLYITQQCVKAYASVIKDAHLLSTIKSHEPLAWSLAQPMQQRLAENTDELNDKMQEVMWNTETIADLEAASQSWERKFAALHAEHTRTQAQLASMVDRERGRQSSSIHGAKAKFCPNCGEQKLMLVCGGGGRYGAVELSTDCMSCGKKWHFTTG